MDSQKLSLCSSFKGYIKGLSYFLCVFCLCFLSGFPHLTIGLHITFSINPTLSFRTSNLKFPSLTLKVLVYFSANGC